MSPRARLAEAILRGRLVTCGRLGVPSGPGLLLARMRHRFVGQPILAASRLSAASLRLSKPSSPAHLLR